jgi:hypothetical protein
VSKYKKPILKPRKGTETKKNTNPFQSPPHPKPHTAKTIVLVSRPSSFSNSSPAHPLVPCNPLPLTPPQKPTPITHQLASRPNTLLCLFLHSLIPTITPIPLPNTRFLSKQPLRSLSFAFANTRTAKRTSAPATRAPEAVFGHVRLAEGADAQEAGRRGS